MRRLASLFIWVFFSITVITHMAFADEVVLDNGDRITGKLVRLQEGKLIFKTDYAGEITIQAKKVSRLATDEPVETTLLDGRIRKATDCMNILSNQSGFYMPVHYSSMQSLPTSIFGPPLVLAAGTSFSNPMS